MSIKGHMDLGIVRFAGTPPSGVNNKLTIPGVTCTIGLRSLRNLDILRRMTDDPASPSYHNTSINQSYRDASRDAQVNAAPARINAELFGWRCSRDGLAQRPSPETSGSQYHEEQAASRPSLSDSLYRPATDSTIQSIC